MILHFAPKYLARSIDSESKEKIEENSCHFLAKTISQSDSDLVLLLLLCFLPTKRSLPKQYAVQKVRLYKKYLIWLRKYIDIKVFLHFSLNRNAANGGANKSYDDSPDGQDHSRGSIADESSSPCRVQ